MTDREKVINALGRCESYGYCEDKDCPYYENVSCLELLRKDALELLKGQEPDVSKYQYKIDHTDCIWYSDSESRCPVTCSQYRDGWNDAMYFIFKNGAGYNPYKRS